VSAEAPARGPGVATGRSLAANAYEELRSLLVRGQIAAGDQIVEVDLAAELGMSRTPVREALLRLELEGYLERDLGSRLVARPPSSLDVTEMFMVRQLLEGEAFRLAATRISDAELGRLDALVAADVRALRRGQLEELAALDLQIHETVIEASRNRTLANLLRRLSWRVHGLNAFAVGSDRDQERFVEEHALFVEQLRDGDEQAAAALLEAHLGRARDLLVAGIEASPPAIPGGPVR
jgi:DNA-binding GntR family transcriptional regulator